jgi:hypothetical protein
MKKLLLTFLVIVLTACAGLGQSDFDRNQKKWQDANVRHYRFSLSIGCFCAFRDQMPLTIEVLDGEFVSITGADGDPIDSTDSNYEYYSRYVTIERLFSELESDSMKEADEVTVTYDSTHGFPAQISIDYIKEAVDDELWLTVSDFEKLP